MHQGASEFSQSASNTDWYLVLLSTWLKLWLIKYNTLREKIVFFFPLNFSENYCLAYFNGFVVDLAVCDIMTV